MKPLFLSLSLSPSEHGTQQLYSSLAQTADMLSGSVAGEAHTPLVGGSAREIAGVDGGSDLEFQILARLLDVAEVDNACLVHLHTKCSHHIS